MVAAAEAARDEAFVKNRMTHYKRASEHGVLYKLAVLVLEMDMGHYFVVLPKTEYQAYLGS